MNYSLAEILKNPIPIAQFYTLKIKTTAPQVSK